MDPLQNKIVLVTRHTRLEDLVARFNTLEQAKFYVEHLGADFSDYEVEDRTYHQVITEAEKVLVRFGRVQRLDRAFLPNFIFPQHTPVVVIGQDGLVANTLKYLQGQPIVAVNPDPARWDGVLLPFKPDDLAKVMPEALANKRPTHSISMACAKLNDGQSLYAVNDLFIGPKSHVSARYAIRLGDKTEHHSSSGIIVSTGLGSSGWFRSVLTGACHIAAGSAAKEINMLREQGFAWESPYLYFSVREPFPSNVTGTDLVFGKVDAETPLRIVSEMPDYGVIFSDGIEADFMEFNSGMEARIEPADRTGLLIN
ncbi:MAG: sugar kinase [Gammaproteobacteria bacterium]|nr:sugar kinase [Gammaproteobacteria bacterium]